MSKSGARPTRKAAAVKKKKSKAAADDDASGSGGDDGSEYEVSGGSGGSGGDESEASIDDGDGSADEDFSDDEPKKKKSKPKPKPKPKSKPQPKAKAKAKAKSQATAAADDASDDEAANRGTKRKSAAADEDSSGEAVFHLPSESEPVAAASDEPTEPALKRVKPSPAAAAASAASPAPAPAADDSRSRRSRKPVNYLDSMTDEEFARVSTEGIDAAELEAMEKRKSDEAAERECERKSRSAAAAAAASGDSPIDLLDDDGHMSDADMKSAKGKPATARRASKSNIQNFLASGGDDEGADDFVESKSTTKRKSSAKSPAPAKLKAVGKSHGIVIVNEKEPELPGTSSPAAD